MIIRNWHYILIAVSSISILSALTAEIIYGLQPCELCLKQRHPYYFIIGITVTILIFRKINKFFLYGLIQLATIYGLFYSLWHVGVENKLLKGPSGCSAGLEMVSNTADLKEQILSKQVISCDEVIWSFFGISAASLNTMILLFIFVINGLYISRLYAK